MLIQEKSILVTMVYMVTASTICYREMEFNRKRTKSLTRLPKLFKFKRLTCHYICVIGGGGGLGNNHLIKT